MGQMAVDKAFVNWHSVLIPGFRALVLSLHSKTKRTEDADV